MPVVLGRTCPKAIGGCVFNSTSLFPDRCVYCDAIRPHAPHSVPITCHAIRHTEPVCACNSARVRLDLLTETVRGQLRPPRRPWWRT